MAMGMMGGGYGIYGYGWIFNAIIVIILLLVIWWVLSQEKSAIWQTKSRSAKNQGFSNQKPEDVLKLRLANGDITIDEYKKLKKEMNK